MYNQELKLKLLTYYYVGKPSKIMANHLNSKLNLNIASKCMNTSIFVINNNKSKIGRLVNS